MPAPVVVWLRDDLRVSDNPALHAAAAAKAPVVPVYVFDDSGDASRPLGAASRWWLHHSLEALGESLEKRGAHLVVRRGSARDEIRKVLHQTGASDLFLNRRYAEGERAEDEAVGAAAADAGVAVHDFQALLLFEPGDVTNPDGEPYAVFSPFWRAAMKRDEPRKPHPAPSHLQGFDGAVHGEPLAALHLLPTHPDWSTGFGDDWLPGEKGAHRRLDEFVHARLSRYEDERDLPAAEASSRLSPHLKFGELSPFQVWHRVQGADASVDEKQKYLAELGWREFDYGLLAAHPRLDVENVHRQFDDFPWAEPDRADLEAWRHGRTGIPLVDAGMRQLWHTGWMHNRVRMVVASFLVKNLRIDWRIGEQWFWDTLVDADPANNPAQWQWVAGSGADAAPFFRVFNPVTQGTKFDPDGEYIKQWVPELRGLAGKALQEPWTARDALDDAAGDDGAAYPAPIVDLKASRQAALDAYAKMRS